jgi:hypothetical protein
VSVKRAVRFSRSSASSLWSSGLIREVRVEKADDMFVDHRDRLVPDQAVSGAADLDYAAVGDGGGEELQVAVANASAASGLTTDEQGRAADGLDRRLDVEALLIAAGHHVIDQLGVETQVIVDIGLQVVGSGHTGITLTVEQPLEDRLGGRIVSSTQRR